MRAWPFYLINKHSLSFFFQQVSAVFVVHLTGAFVCLGCGLIYCILHTAASYRMFPLYNGKIICRIRLFISLVALAAFLTGAFSQFKYIWLWFNCVYRLTRFIDLLILSIHWFSRLLDVIDRFDRLVALIAWNDYLL